MKNTQYRRISVEDIELGALDQINNILQLPFLKALAIMPDIHQGYGVPIGSVVATSPDVVIPNAVGVDIGCGMIVAHTTIKADILSRDILSSLCDTIRKYVPVGFKKRKNPVTESDMPLLPYTNIVDAHIYNAKRSMGTLGGGNHFIEIQADVMGDVWIMVHSGSRNLGKQVCDYYNNLAKTLNHICRSSVAPKWDLAFLPRGNDLYHDYLKDMKYCIDFARLNRAYIMEQIRTVFMLVLGGSSIKMPWMPAYDICHNHAAIENHMGSNMMVHRKGAAGPYSTDTVGIIPGSQGTSSYLVTYRDTACPTAMRTTSHGAGRTMGRKAAQRTLDLQEQLSRMKGIVHGITDKSNLDEAPGAYKDIDDVMRNQSDLCKIITKLRPLAVVKG